AHDEVERAGCDFAKSGIAIEGYGDADGRVLSSELEAAFEQTIVEFVDVQWSTLFAQQQRHGLRDRTVHEAVAQYFDVVANGWNLLPAFGLSSRRLSHRR